MATGSLPSGKKMTNISQRFNILNLNSTFFVDFLIDTISFLKYSKTDILNLVFGIFLHFQEAFPNISAKIYDGFKIQVVGCWQCEIYSFVFPSHPQDAQGCGTL